MLHHPKRDVESLEVLDQRAAILPEVHRATELGRIGRGQLDVMCARQIEDGVEAERAVEVDVQVRLGKLVEEVERERPDVGVVSHDLLYQLAMRWRHDEQRETRRVVPQSAEGGVRFAGGSLLEEARSCSGRATSRAGAHPPAPRRLTDTEPPR